MTPPVSPDVDLRDFPFMPLDAARLFASEFHARASDAEWRAGVTLWLKSWHQIPAASIPNDDVALARLAEFGRDVKSWRKVRTMALYGWVECDDGRLYHPVVAEKVNEAWQKKQAFRDRTEKARIARLQQRLLQSDAPSVTDALKVSNKERNNVSNSIQGTGTGTVKEETTGADAPAPDPVRELWLAGVRLLTDAGSDEKSARALLGKLRREHGDIAVMESLTLASTEHPSSPVPWLLKTVPAMGGRSKSSVKAGNSRLKTPAPDEYEGLSL